MGTLSERKAVGNRTRRLQRLRRFLELFSPTISPAHARIGGGEDGIAGFSHDKQRLCFALALWNGRDPILKKQIAGTRAGAASMSSYAEPTFKDAARLAGAGSDRPSAYSQWRETAAQRITSKSRLPQTVRRRPVSQLCEVQNYEKNYKY